MLSFLSMLSIASYIAVGNTQMVPTTMSCYNDPDYYWYNVYTGAYTAYKPGYAFSRIIFSDPSPTPPNKNYPEDYKYRFGFCKPETTYMDVANKEILPETLSKMGWLRTCGDFNGGHTVISEMKTWMSNNDRIYQVTCAKLDVLQFRLGKCSWISKTGNELHCPANGVMRAMRDKLVVINQNECQKDIWGHQNCKKSTKYAHDYGIECCSMYDYDYDYNFEDIVGEWRVKQYCHGCKTTEYTIATGTDSSITTDITQSYGNELSRSVALGFEFDMGVSGSAEVTDTKSQTISNSMQESFSQTYSESTTFICENAYLYQWVMEGEEASSDGSSGTFSVYSNYYLCIDAADPKCPPGYCEDGDCQTCKD